MAFKDYIDKDTRNFILLVLGFALFIYFVLPRIEPFLFTADFSAPLTPLFPGANNTSVYATPVPINLVAGKDYTAEVNTTAGQFKMDLYESSAPKNVANLVSLLSAYANSPTDVEANYLFKVDSEADVKYSIDDEINADYLLLDTVKVKDAAYLRAAYDPNDSSTNAFEPNNLRKYEDYTVKQFYSEILGYKYDGTLATPRAVKYTVYMASTGPNQNKADFFVLMANSSPEIDGRYTPVGRITEGFTVLDKINASNDNAVIVQSIVIP